MNINEEVSNKEYRAHKKQLKRKRKQLVRSEAAASVPAFTKRGKERKLKKKEEFNNELTSIDSEMSEIESKYDINNRKDRRKLKKLRKIIRGSRNEGQYEFKHKLNTGIAKVYWTNSYRASNK